MTRLTLPSNSYVVEDYTSGTPGTMQGLGLSADENKRLGDYYWAMKSQGIGAAQSAMGIADQWVELQAAKVAAIAQLRKQTAGGLPELPAGAFVPGPFGVPIPTPAFMDYMNRVGTIYSTNFKPALDKLTELYVKPEHDLKMAAATSGWLVRNMYGIAVKNMQTIRENIPQGEYDDSWAAGVIKKGGLDPYAGGFKRHADFWVVKSGEAASNYFRVRAPELYAVMTSAAWTQTAKDAFLKTVDREAIAREAGIEPYNVDKYLQQYGMAGLGEPITLTTLLVVALVTALLAGGVAYMVGYGSGGKAAAAEAGRQFDKLAALHNQQMQDLKAKAQAIINATASAKTPSEAAAIAAQGNAALDQQVKTDVAVFKAQVEQGKREVNEAKGGWDFSSLLAPVGIVLAAVIGLKAAKII